MSNLLEKFILGPESRSELAFMSIGKIDDFIENRLKRPQRCHFHQFVMWISHVKSIGKVHSGTRIEVRASAHEHRQNRRFYVKLFKTASYVLFSPN